MSQYVQHVFPPIYNASSKVLILGTIPSPKSRENGFYYSHPQNKFWKVLSHILQQPCPITVNEKEQFLLANTIAVWDVLHSCQIAGADDSSIRDEIPNDLSEILQAAPIQVVFTTGKKAETLYKKHMAKRYTVGTIPLPSTSPANCRFYTFDDLCRAYSIVLDYL